MKKRFQIFIFIINFYVVFNLFTINYRTNEILKVNQPNMVSFVEKNHYISQENLLKFIHQVAKTSKNLWDFNKIIDSLSINYLSNIIKNNYFSYIIFDLHDDNIVYIPYKEAIPLQCHDIVKDSDEIFTSCVDKSLFKFENNKIFVDYTLISQIKEKYFNGNYQLQTYNLSTIETEAMNKLLKDFYTVTHRNNFIFFNDKFLIMTMEEVILSCLSNLEVASPTEGFPLNIKKTFSIEELLINDTIKNERKIALQKNFTSYFSHQSCVKHKNPSNLTQCEGIHRDISQLSLDTFIEIIIDSLTPSDIILEKKYGELFNGNSPHLKKTLLSTDEKNYGADSLLLTEDYMEQSSNPLDNSHTNPTNKTMIISSDTNIKQASDTHQKYKVSSNSLIKKTFTIKSAANENILLVKGKDVSLSQWNIKKSKDLKSKIDESNPMDKNNDHHYETDSQDSTVLERDYHDNYVTLKINQDSKHLYSIVLEEYDSSNYPTTKPNTISKTSINSILSPHKNYIIKEILINPFSDQHINLQILNKVITEINEQDIIITNYEETIENLSKELTQQIEENNLILKRFDDNIDDQSLYQKPFFNYDQYYLTGHQLYMELKQCTTIKDQLTKLENHWKKISIGKENNSGPIISLMANGEQKPWQKEDEPSSLKLNKEEVTTENPIAQLKYYLNILQTQYKNLRDKNTELLGIINQLTIDNQWKNQLQIKLNEITEDYNKQKTYIETLAINKEALENEILMKNKICTSQMDKENQLSNEIAVFQTKFNQQEQDCQIILREFHQLKNKILKKIQLEQNFLSLYQQTNEQTPEQKHLILVTQYEQQSVINMNICNIFQNIANMKQFNTILDNPTGNNGCEKDVIDTQKPLQPINLLPPEITSYKELEAQWKKNFSPMYFNYNEDCFVIIHRIEQEKIDLNNELISTKKHHKQLLKTKELEYQKNFNEKQKIIEDLKKEMERLANQLTTENPNNFSKTKMTNIKKLNQQNNKLNLQLSEQRAKHQKELDEKNSDFQKQLEICQEKISQWEKDNKELTNEILKKEQLHQEELLVLSKKNQESIISSEDKDNLTINSEIMKNLQKELNELKSQHDQKIEDYDEQRSHIEKLTKEKEKEKTDLSKELQQKNKEISQLRIKNNELKSKNEEMLKSVQLAGQCKSQLDQISSEYKIQNKDQKNKIDELSKSNDFYMANCAQQTLTIEILQQEKTQLESQLKSKDNYHDTLEKKIGKHNESLVQIAKELDQKQLSSLQEEPTKLNEALTKENSNFKIQVDDQTEISTLEEKFNQLKNQYDQKIEEYKRQEIHINNFKQQTATEKHSLSKKLEITKKELNDLLSKNHTLKEKNKEQDKEINQILKDCQSKTDQFNVIKQKVQKLAEKLKEYQAFQIKYDELNQSYEKLVIKNNERVKADEDFVKKQVILNETRDKQFMEIIDRSNNYKKQLAELTTKYNELEKTYNELIIKGSTKETLEAFINKHDKQLAELATKYNELETTYNESTKNIDKLIIKGSTKERLKTLTNKYNELEKTYDESTKNIDELIMRGSPDEKEKLAALKTKYHELQTISNESKNHLDKLRKQLQEESLKTVNLVKDIQWKEEKLDGPSPVNEPKKKVLMNTLTGQEVTLEDIETNINQWFVLVSKAEEEKIKYYKEFQLVIDELEKKKTDLNNELVRIQNQLPSVAKLSVKSNKQSNKHSKKTSDPIESNIEQFNQAIEKLKSKLAIQNLNYLINNEEKLATSILQLEKNNRELTLQLDQEKNNNKELSNEKIEIEKELEKNNEESTKKIQEIKKTNQELKQTNEQFKKENIDLKEQLDRKEKEIHLSSTQHNEKSNKLIEMSQSSDQYVTEETVGQLQQTIIDIKKNLDDQKSKFMEEKEKLISSESNRTSVIQLENDQLKNNINQLKEEISRLKTEQCNSLKETTDNHKTIKENNEDVVKNTINNQKKISTRSKFIHGGCLMIGGGIGYGFSSRRAGNRIPVKQRPVNRNKIHPNSVENTAPKPPLIERID